MPDHARAHSLAPRFVDGVAQCRGCRTVLFWSVHGVATPPYVPPGLDVLLALARRGWGVRLRLVEGLVLIKGGDDIPTFGLTKRARERRPDAYRRRPNRDNRERLHRDHRIRIYCPRLDCGRQNLLEFPVPPVTSRGRKGLSAIDNLQDDPI